MIIVVPSVMAPASLRRLAGFTVLVVDDHRETLDMLTEYLTACGATALGSGTAKTALVLAEAHAVDAVIVDLRLPDEDGYWFLRQLRASRTASANASVIAVTGERHDAHDPAASFAGFFVKPVDLDALVDSLARIRTRG